MRLAQSPATSAQWSRAAGLCVDCMAHVLGHQALLPAGDCLRETALCGLSVLILCLFMAFPNWGRITVGIGLSRGKAEKWKISEESQHLLR